MSPGAAVVAAVDGIATRLAALASGLGSLAAVLAVGMVGAGFLVPSGDYVEIPPKAPVRIVAETAAIDAKVVPIPVYDGVLEPPSDIHTLGWWQASAKPGARTGQTVLTGHTLHTGGGALDRLHDLRVGDTIDVHTKAGKMRYEVIGTERFERQQVTDQAVELFGQETGGGRLVLVSCTDWNGSFHERNYVVFAAPLGSPVEERRRNRTVRAGG